MRRAFVLVALLAFAGCGSTPTTPTNNTPNNSPAPTRSLGLSGSLALGDVLVGNSKDATLTISNTGNSPMTLTSLTAPTGFATSFQPITLPGGTSAPINVRFSPTENKSYSGLLTASGDQTSGANTIGVSGNGTLPPGPKTQFGNGQYLVNIDIVAGRYYTVPPYGCYYERERGLSGSLSDIIANEFIAYVAGQWIVDIKSSDKAFKSDGCGTWFNSPRRGLQATITQGLWLVGSQITPGTYRTQANYGCYWARVRDFTSEVPGGIIANNFVGTAGQQLVTIASSDLGFETDDDCGTWSLASASEIQSLTKSPPQTLAEIQANRAMKPSRGPIR